jgi:DNA-binding transcriptional MerR regulator
MFTLASMTSLRVSELAARAGVSASAVRFYERAGLLPVARRAANGYRVFDDSAADDLALIGRAKALGMNLNEITSLVAAWHGSECGAAHALLRSHLAGLTARLIDRAAELDASRQRSQAAFGRLTARAPEHGECHTACACAEAFASGPYDGSSRPAGCTLEDEELACRVGEWHALAAAALSAERGGGFLRLVLAPAMIPSAAALIAAEATCCPDARFTLEATAGRALLTAEFS